MGNFGSYEEAIATVRAKKDFLREQVGDQKLTPTTIGVLAGLDLAIKYLEEVLIDEMRIMEGHYLQEEERNNH